MACAVLALAPGRANGGLVEIPFDPAHFPNQPEITNPYWPLLVGDSFVYYAQTEDECSYNKLTVTNHTRTVMGVRTQVVRGQEWVTELTEDGLCDLSTATMTEDTVDYYAQDYDGNIWYFGEATWALEDGVCTSEGSWEAGVAPAPGAEPAEPGIVMLADPRQGDRYRQELAEDVAEDMAKVLRLNASVSIALGEFNECLKTGEWTPLSSGIEHKFYCFDALGHSAGLVFIEELKGKTVYVELIGDTLPAAFPGEYPPTSFPAICGP